MEEKWYWILAIVGLIILGILLQSQGGTKQPLGQTSSLGQKVVTCKNYSGCINKLQDMGYSKKEIAKFKISCSRERCVVR